MSMNNNKPNQVQQAKQLQDFHTKVEQQINLIQQGVRVSGKQDEQEEVGNLMKQLKPVIDTIATTGDASQYNWLHLRSLIVIMTREVLQFMQKTYPYVQHPTINESYEDELDVILQFICGFDNKTPFTLQRICELLLSPEKNYRSSKKILFAMEKLVNVSQI